MTSSTQKGLYPRQIVDRHGRVFDYLRIALTERCNLRCLYCMPEEGVVFKGGELILDAMELRRVIAVFARLGVAKLRFTGGEPLVRKDVCEIVHCARETPGITSVHLTTNGLLLKKMGQALRGAGLDGVNISLDTLRPERFKRITRRDGVENVLEAIQYAVLLGFPSVKVNVVAMREFNDDELDDFVALTKELPITLRFIELMPFDAQQIWRTGKFFGVHLIREHLERSYPGMERVAGSSTEEYVIALAGHRGCVALIPAFTRSLCGGCNRIRLTADGQIRNCLYSDHEFGLRQLLRAGADDEALAELIKAAMRHKAVDGWQAQRESTKETEHRVSMTQIGG
jgi:cyclic pyranopterin phosphate synthase